MRKILSILLAVMIFAGTTLPALAVDETTETEASEALLDPEELGAIIEEYMASRNLADYNFGVAYCYTGTGETWSYNAEKYFEAASLFKLPLMMCLANEIANGELSMEDTIFGATVEYIMSNTLLHSNNDTADLAVAYYQPYRNYRTMIAELADIPEEKRPETYYDRNILSAEFMLNVLKKLYANPETYPYVIDYMKQAQPGEFFRVKLGSQYEIAQKYGAYSGIAHTAAIVYTPTPCLGVVMTQHLGSSRDVIADVSEILANYTLTLDERFAQREAEKQAAAEKAEQERLAEEARIKAEEEAAEKARLEAEAEAQRAAEEAERIAEEERLLAMELAAKKSLQIKIVCISVLSVVLLAAAILTVRKIKRK